jgi:hypothetical protein
MDGPVVDAQDREAFARRFFSGANAVRWTPTASPTRSGEVVAKDQAQPWLDGLRSGDDPIILPFSTPNETVWYVATETARGFRHLREELVALLGPTYSDFCGQPTFLDPTNPIDADLGASLGTYVLRIRVPNEHAAAARSRFELFASLRSQAPRRKDTQPRPAGRILADFEEALRRGSDEVASECIEEFEANGHLDAHNLLYLRMRLDEARANWQSVLDAAHRYHLILASRRPRRVSQAILRAVYATKLASYESVGDSVGAVRCFRDEVYGQYGALLATRTAYSCPEADALFVLRAVNDARTRSDAVGALAKAGREPSARPWLAALIETLPVAPPSPARDLGEPIAQSRPPTVEHEMAPSVDRLSAAREAFYAGELDLAWELALGVEPSGVAAPFVIACACDVGTLAAAQHALDFVGKLSASVRDALERRKSVSMNIELLRRLIAPLVATADAAAGQPQVPQDWVGWIEAICANQEWEEAVAVAEDGALDWDPMEFQRSDSMTRFARALAEVAAPGHRRISESLPHILRSVSRCPSLPRKAGEVLETLTLIHLCEDAPGRMFFGTLADLCNLTLSVGVTRLAYVSLLGDCISSIARSAGPADFDGLLELLDVLVTYAAPDPTQRTAVAGAIAELFVRFRARAEPSQLGLLRQLLQDADCDVPAGLTSAQGAGAPDRAQNPLARLVGKSIALYSLNEPALHRIATLLKESVDGVSVNVFSDKVGGSAALKSAARNADVFVVATAAALHAATIFIEAERGSRGATLKPSGQGSASMLSVLRDYARSLGPGT